MLQKSEYNIYAKLVECWKKEEALDFRVQGSSFFKQQTKTFSLFFLKFFETRYVSRIEFSCYDLIFVPLDFWIIKCVKSFSFN